MRYALGRQEPTPKARSQCPLCGDEVIAKCGKIVTWHWAHAANDCDQWSEPETQWHVDWKERYPLECREVVIGKHRADVHFEGRTIEFQNSPISRDEISEREQFYGKGLVWVVNGSSFESRFLMRSRRASGGSDYWTFRWKHAHSSWFGHTRELFIDFCDEGILDRSRWRPGVHKERGLFWVKRLGSEFPCGGWGKWVSRGWFVKWSMKPSQKMFSYL